MAHARLSPSSSARWLTCLASPVMEAGKPNTTNSYAAEGTAAHFLGETCLLEDLDAEHYLSSKILVGTDGSTYFDGFGTPKGFETEYSFEVDEHMAGHVQEYVTLVRDIRDINRGELLVEQKLPLTGITGEEGATGTADAVILTEDKIFVVDLKYGQGLRVVPENNTQLMIYALAALLQFEMLGDFKEVEMVISQPRKDHTASWALSVEDLVAFMNTVIDACSTIAELTPQSDLSAFLQPSEDACRYCKANAECRALAEYNLKTISADFDDLDEIGVYNIEKARYNTHQLGEIYKRIPLLEQWIKTVSSQVYSELMNGGEIQGLKLVKGKRGNRKWSNETEVEEVMKSIKLKADYRYDRKLTSPTNIEKLVKAGELSAAKWDRLAALIVKPEGKPSVALAEDPRDMISITDDFDDLDEIKNNSK